MRRVRYITAEEENFRMEPLASGPGYIAEAIRRDPVEPEPVGTYVLLAFKVIGYDEDCDGSLMARLQHVDFNEAEPSGWEPSNIGLYQESELVVTKEELHDMYHQACRNERLARQGADNGSNTET